MATTTAHYPINNPVYKSNPNGHYKESNVEADTLARPSSSESSLSFYHRDSTRSDSSSSAKLEELYQRALSRIASLEASLEYQRTSHSDQLKGLHEEIYRLQSICNDLNMKLVMRDGVVQPQKPNVRKAPSGVARGVSANTSATSSQMLYDTNSPHGGSGQNLHSSKNATLTTKNVSMNVIDESADQDVLFFAKSEKMKTDIFNLSSKEEEEEPLSILLNKQKLKYTAMLEKSRLDMKRQKQEMDRLKSEVSILKDVLALGTGIRFDPKDLKEAVLAYQQATLQVEHRFHGSKQGALAPSAESDDKLKSMIVKQTKVLPPIVKLKEQQATVTDKSDSPQETLLAPHPPETGHPTNHIRTKSRRASHHSTLGQGTELQDKTDHVGGIDEAEEYHTEQALDDEHASMLSLAREKIASHLLSGPEKKTPIRMSLNPSDAESISHVPGMDLPHAAGKLNMSWNKRVHGIQAIRKKQQKDV